MYLFKYFALNLFLRWGEGKNSFRTGAQKRAAKG